MTTSKLYIASVSGSRSCHNDDDTDRALEAAQLVIKPEQEKAAFDAFLARVNDEDHDASLADLWEKAQGAADIALTRGWDNPSEAFCELAINE